MTCMLRLAAALFQGSAPPDGWRSMTMRRLDAALTPGTPENLAAALALAAITLPWSRAAAGFVLGSIRRGG